MWLLVLVVLVWLGPIWPSLEMDASLVRSGEILVCIECEKLGGRRGLNEPLSPALAFR